MYAKLAIQLQQKLGYRKANKWNRRATTDRLPFLSNAIRSQYSNRTVYNATYYLPRYQRGTLLQYKAPSPPISILISELYQPCPLYV